MVRRKCAKGAVRIRAGTATRCDRAIADRIIGRNPPRKDMAWPQPNACPPLAKVSTGAAISPAKKMARKPHAILMVIARGFSRKVSVELRLRDAGRFAVIAPNPSNRQLKNMPDPREPHDSLYGAGRIDHRQSAARTGFRKPPTQLDCLLTIQYLGRMPRMDAHENVTCKFRYGVHR